MIAMILSLFVAAVPLPDPSSDLGGYIQSALDSLKAGNYRLLLALALMGLIFGARKLAEKLGWAWIGTDRGGTITALVTGVVATLAASIATGAQINIWLLVDGLVAGITAIGGYAAIKKLLSPSDAAPAA